MEAFPCSFYPPFDTNQLPYATYYAIMQIDSSYGIMQFESGGGMQGSGAAEQAGPWHDKLSTVTSSMYINKYLVSFNTLLH